METDLDAGHTHATLLEKVANTSHKKLKRMARECIKDITEGHT